MENTREDDNSFNIIINSWKRRKWWLTGLFLLSVAIGISGILALPELYRSQTTMLLGQDAISEALVMTNLDAQLEQRLHLTEQEILSREQLLAFIEKHNLYPGLRGRAPDSALVERMRKDTYIATESITQPNQQQRLQNSPIEVVIGYQGWEPGEVAAITNDLALLYQEIYEKTRFKRASRTADFLNDQLKVTSEELSKQEALIREFNEKHIGSLPQQEAANIATLQRLNMDLGLNKERQAQQLNQQRTIDPTQNFEFGSLANMPDELRLGQLKRQLVSMTARYNPSHPAIIRLKNEIDMLEKQDREITVASPGTEIFAMNLSLPEEEKMLHNAIENLQDRFNRMPAVAQELQRLENDYSAIRERYLALQRQYEDARLAQSLELEQNQEYQVLEYALPADFSAEPNKMQLMVMVIALSGIGVFLLAIIAEKMDQSFRTVQQLRAYTSVPVLASIRKITTSGEKFKSGALSVLGVTLYAILFTLLVVLAYYAGQQALQIVWIIAGSNG